MRRQTTVKGVRMITVIMRGWQWYVLIWCLLIGIQGTAQAQMPKIMAATPVVVYMPVVFDNPDFFELSAKQKQQVAVLAQNTNAQRESLDQSIVDLRQELREEQLKYHSDAKLVRYLVGEIQKQENQRLQLSIDCANGLRGILTEKQWATLIELAQE